MYELISALILSIALEVGIPPYLALAVALEENSTLNPEAVSCQNRNGTYDLGVMQLNSEYFGCIEWRDPETNIRAGCRLIKELIVKQEINTYWTVAVCYNAGTRWLKQKEKPPDSSIEYAERVMNRWAVLERYRPVLIRK